MSPRTMIFALVLVAICAVALQGPASPMPGPGPGPGPAPRSPRRMIVVQAVWQLFGWFHNRQEEPPRYEDPVDVVANTAPDRELGDDGHLQVRHGHGW